VAKRKPGKYDHILCKLKPLPPQDLTAQQKIDDEKKALRICDSCNATGSAKDGSACQHCDGTGKRKLNAQILALLYAQQRANIEMLAMVMSQASNELEAIVQLLIATHDREVPDDAWGAFGASDRAIKMLDGGSIRLQPEIYPIAKDKAAFREWCFAHGLRNKMELPVKPMTDLLKNILLNAEKEPTGVETYVRTKVVYTPLKTTEVSEQPTDVQEMTF
jgi:hypothetical protein